MASKATVAQGPTGLPGFVMNPHDVVDIVLKERGMGHTILVVSPHMRDVTNHHKVSHLLSPKFQSVGLSEGLPRPVSSIKTLLA